MQSNGESSTGAGLLTSEPALLIIATSNAAPAMTRREKEAHSPLLPRVHNAAARQEHRERNCIVLYPSVNGMVPISLHWSRNLKIR